MHWSPMMTDHDVATGLHSNTLIRLGPPVIYPACHWWEEESLAVCWACIHICMFMYKTDSSYYSVGFSCWWLIDNIEELRIQRGNFFDIWWRRATLHLVIHVQHCWLDLEVSLGGFGCRCDRVGLLAWGLGENEGSIFLRACFLKPDMQLQHRSVSWRTSRKYRVPKSNLNFCVDIRAVMIVVYISLNLEGYFGRELSKTFGI